MSATMYGLLAAGVLFLVELFANMLFRSSLSKSREKRVAEAKAAGRPEPNDDIAKYIMLSGLIVLPLIGYFQIGPILAEIMGAAP